MRKWFIFLSTVLLSVFIVIRIQQENQQLQFLSYNAVDIVGRSGNSELSSREEFTDALNGLAIQTDSVIARRIVEPQENGKVKFVYEVYGEGSLPKGWERASKVSVETSDLVNSYLIVSGSLTSDKLAEVIKQEGYSPWISSGYSIYYSIYSLLMSEEFLVSIALCLLTFVSLTLIYRIKDLRSAGIRRVSGQSFAKIIFLPLTTDGVILGLTYLINASLAVSILFYLQLLNDLTLSIILLSIALFVVTLFILSLSLSLVYVLGLKVITLVEVLKGKLPLKRLLALMLLGQLASILVVGWTVNRTLIHFNELQTVEKGVEGWDKNKDYYQASYSYGAAFNGEMSKEEQDSRWYQFAKVAIQNHGALFVKNNLNRYLQGDESDGINKFDYAPSGHTIFVTPNYLELQNIQVSEEFKSKMSSLQQGEFGLIIPDKLKGQEETLVQLYVDYLNSFGRENLDIESSQLFEFKPYISYVESNQSRFLYNTVPYILEQHLIDPIIVVITPESTGDTPASQILWGTSLQSLFLLDYQQSVQLLKEQGVYQWVSYLLNSKSTYYENLNTIRNQFLFLLLGALIGIATSILLFNTMNLVYFEQFRREIFIRRLAGMTFIELHFIYLITQLLVLGVGMIGLLFVTSELGLSVGTGSIFLTNLFLILFLQERKESMVAYTVLQGG
ncbi:TPA: bacteriocin-associated integral membrane family protein [Streptococcus suis]|nr:bacteriocin-associated integral membrane family protein [Streptococcus suis]